MIGDPEGRCIDFTGAEWQNVMPEARQAACIADGKLYGLQIWHNSPEYVMVYNKTLFDELGIEKVPTTYEEFLDRYLKIVPGASFGIYKEDLLPDSKLKKFLGY